MKALIFIEAPGKIPAWSRIASTLGIDAQIIATAGHLCRFSDNLHPLGIRIAKGRAIDVGRVVRPETEHCIRDALRGRKDDTKILIAMDDDPEGDVIALDVMRLIIDMDPGLLAFCMRLRPGAINRVGIERSIAKAEKLGGDMDSLVSNAVSGRTRALTDRWMGATFSRMTNAGCGRVRAGILGSALCWSQSPDMIRGLPETGEITLQARSSSGGLPFTAYVPISGRIPAALASVATRYAGRLIPGHVSLMKSIGAAVAPRFDNIQPFNTGDALVYAARFHDIGPGMAMSGLQSAYMAGRISYPRTDNRTISEESAVSVVQAARVCGLRDVDMRYVQNHIHEETTSGITSHEGICPTPRMTREELERLRELVIRPISPLRNAQDVENLMVTLVARRAFESLRDGALVPGVFHAREDSDLTAEERQALADLDWTRARGANVPWSNARTTGLRIWSLAPVIIEGMMIEEIGRPSTLAGHAELVDSSGQLRFPEPGALPEPSPEGRRILKALPRGIWLPSMCRMIEKAMHSEALNEDENAEITRRMRSRVDAWFGKISAEIRGVLVETLKSEADSGGRVVSKGIAAIVAAEIDPVMDAAEDQVVAPEF